MLDHKGFDLWADGYDKTVGLSDEENTYPFAGYKEVLGRIYQTVLEKEHPVVLDLGFGTGTLTAKLYEQGCDIWGQDFSDRMIELASAKMPDAHLYQGDFSQGLVEPLLQNTYDFIVATYSLHHLTDESKISFLRSLTCLLKEDGIILIGDVAFADREGLERCQKDAGDEWDDEEIYFVFDELKKVFPNMRFETISYCAGLLFLPWTFHFEEKFDMLTSPDLSLKITQKFPGDEVQIPFYYYDILDSYGHTVGKISIRIGNNFHSYYNGHIGYEIFKAYRGRGYAYRACKMVLDVARFHGMGHIYLTCDESNIASSKTIERLGAQLIEICDVPQTYFAWYEEMERQRIYRLDL